MGINALAMTGVSLMSLSSVLYARKRSKECEEDKNKKGKGVE